MTVIEGHAPTVSRGRPLSSRAFATNWGARSAVVTAGTLLLTSMIAVSSNAAGPVVEQLSTVDLAIATAMLHEEQAVTNPTFAVRDVWGDVRIYREVKGPSVRNRKSIDIRRAEITDFGKRFKFAVTMRSPKQGATTSDRWDQIATFDLTPAAGAQGGWVGQVAFASHRQAGYGSISWSDGSSFHNCDLPQKNVGVKRDQLSAWVPRRCVPPEAARVRVTTATSEFRTDAHNTSRDRVTFADAVAFRHPGPRETTRRSEWMAPHGHDRKFSTLASGVGVSEKNRRWGFRIKRGSKHFCTIDLQDDGVGPWVTCFLDHYTYDPPPEGDCPLAWGGVMYVGTVGNGQFLCYGGLLYPPEGPRLGPAESFTKGRFTCTNKGPGIRCWNRRTGHGFRQSEGGWRRF